MNDRTLLELAAKAAGLIVRGMADRFVAQHNYGPDGFVVVNDRGGDSLWNPLVNDGDAMRLAVKIRMFDGSLFELFMIIRLEETRLNPARSDEEIARRAIVRAAAAIGQEMK